MEYVIPAGITAPDGISPAHFTNGPDGRPQLQFKINTFTLDEMFDLLANFSFGDNITIMVIIIIILVRRAAPHAVTTRTKGRLSPHAAVT